MLLDLQLRRARKELVEAVGLQGINPEVKFVQNVFLRLDQLVFVQEPLGVVGVAAWKQLVHKLLRAVHYDDDSVARSLEGVLVLVGDEETGGQREIVRISLLQHSV